MKNINIHWPAVVVVGLTLAAGIAALYFGHTTEGSALLGISAGLLGPQAVQP